MESQCVRGLHAAATNQPINQSISQPAINQSTNQSTNRSIITAKPAGQRTDRDDRTAPDDGGQQGMRAEQA
jgi:hypothetical protein